MDFVLPAPVKEALGRLEAAGYAAYAVGGCVRDHVLGMEPHDYDICTSAAPQEMQKVFQGERTIETGIKHGTLTVLLSGMPLEITTFRVDGEYLDGRHPSSVRFADRVEDDLSRRDFTINAMAYSPKTGLVDPFGGQADCKRGVIRCVGEAEQRFGEDALRILRALRFSARLGFPIEEATARAAHAGRDMLQKISRERIAAELTGTLMGAHCAQVLADFPDVLCAAIPDLEALTRSDRWPHTLRTLTFAPQDPTLRWAALLMEAPRPDRFDLPYEILQGLKMPTKLCETVRKLTPIENRSFRKGLPSIRWLLMRLGPEQAEQMLLLLEADMLALHPASSEKAIRKEYRQNREELHRLLDENVCYSLSQLAVNGQDMAKAGLRGPQIGQTLNRLLLQVVMNELPNEREALLNAIHQENEDNLRGL
ncbi:MAG: CCA tRNA nucleotidyltransferase [Clostridia bacterium]|nr:CCA tRNA nucleotidyltransferase [Clostridia bacterium]